ncbi:MAG: hypothetical protein Kow0088_27120 [Anaerolineales bacterium]
MIIWFGYELFLRNPQQVLSSALAAGVSLLSFGLFWYLLPPTREALTQYDQIRIEKEEAQQLLDHLPNLIIFKDLGSTYRKVNLSFAQTLGKAADLLIGRSDADFLPPKIAQMIQEDEKRAIASKQTVTRKIELITTKGNRWFEMTFTPVIDKLGVTQGVLVSGTDLTELIEEKQILEKNVQLREKLTAVLQKMSRCDDETELEELILEMTEELGGTPNVALALVLDDGDTVLLRKSRRTNLFQLGRTLSAVSGFVGKIVQSGQLQSSEDLSSLKEVLQIEESKRMQWVVGLPVQHDARVWGIVLLLYEQSNEAIITHRKEILTDGARAASLKLSELRYRRELEKRLAQTRRDLEQTALRQRVDHFLTALSIRLMNAPHQQIDGLLEKAIGSFAEYVGAEKSYVYLFTKDGGGLHAQYRWAASGKLLPPTEISEPYDTTMLWLLEKINRQEVISLSRVGEFADAFRLYFDAQDIDFLVAAPMVLRRTVMGYFGLEGKEEDAGRVTEQVDIVKSMADILISALDRKWSAADLEERLRGIGEKIAHLELNNRRSQVLAEMADLLQSCRTADEAFPIIAHYAQTLIPESTGALYLLRSLQGVAEKVSQWGRESSGENELALNECWGIRRGKIHISQDAEGPVCDHLGEPIPQRYICVPLIAQGETIGLLHIRDVDGSGENRMDEMSKIGISIAEHIAPALSNLNLRDKLRSQAIRDPLTGLFNRRYMEETLDREIRRAARHQYSVGLIMCDIDQMKPINDNHGHDAGDVVLRQIGGLMKKIFRGEDVACRYGGDEFVVILPEASLSDVWQRAEHLRESVKKMQYEYDGKSIGPVTLSIGIAAFPELGSTVERLIQVSDAAVYLAKHEGGDRVMIAHRTDENSK